MRGPILLACAALLAAPVQAAQCSARADTPVALLELYTSEGCSSCPPADRWLSSLGRQAHVVPLALHVDYWDYIGWRDRYAQPRFGERQKQAVRLSGARAVYTPQVMLNGRDFRAWDNLAAFERALRAANARPPQATLALTAREGAARAWAVELGGKLLRGDRRAEAYLALYENGLSTEVKAGENRGTRLQHDFVVREWVGPLPLAADGRIALTHAFPPRGDIDYGRSSVAAFVQDAQSGEVLQALALALCPAETAHGKLQ
jgi:hypothetical protein